MAIGVPSLIGAVISLPTTVPATSNITVGAGGVPAGATIVVMVNEGHATTAGSVTDAKSNNYVNKISFQGGTSDIINHFLADNVAALVSGDTIVIHWPLAQSAEGFAAAYYITGLATSSFDVAKSNGSVLATAANTGDFTTTNANDIAIGMVCGQSAPTIPPWTLNNGYTALDNANAGGGDGVQWGYQIYSSTQSSGDAYGTTFSANSQFIAGVMALKAAAAGAALTQIAYGWGPD